MVAKIVVVKGCSRRVRCGASRCRPATATIVPVAIRSPIVGRRGRPPPCSASPTSTCTVGWTGGAGAMTTSLPSPRWTPMSSCSRRHGPPTGTRQRRTGGAGGTPSGLPGGGARHSAAGRRIRPQADADHRWIARPSMRDRNRALYIDGVRPLSDGVQALARWQEAEPGHMGHRRPGAARAARSRPLAWCSCARCGPTGCGGRRSWST